MNERNLAIGTMVKVSLDIDGVRHYDYKKGIGMRIKDRISRDVFNTMSNAKKGISSSRKGIIESPEAMSAFSGGLSGLTHVGSKIALPLSLAGGALGGVAGAGIGYLTADEDEDASYQALKYGLGGGLAGAGVGALSGLAYGAGFGSGVGVGKAPRTLNQLLPMGSKGNKVNYV